MELFETLLKRRSCRDYLEKEVSDEDLDKLMHAAMSGPSAMNKKPWEFYIIKDKDKLEKARKLSNWSNINAPVAIIVCGNMSHALPLGLQDFWMQDVSAAIENILLAATALGLGSLWCGLLPQKRSVKKAQELLKVNKKIVPLGLIYVGYAKKESKPRDQYEENKIHII